MFDVETIVPGYYICTNHWNRGHTYWNPQAASFGHGARPGDFIIPWQYGIQSIVTEGDSVSPVAVQPVVDLAKPLKDWEPGAWNYYLQTNDPNWLKTIGQTDVAWAQYLGAAPGLAARLVDRLLQRKRVRPPLPPLPGGR